MFEYYAYPVDSRNWFAPLQVVGLTLDTFGVACFLSDTNDEKAKN
jgi:hypothetical protein